VARGRRLRGLAAALLCLLLGLPGVASGQFDNLLAQVAPASSEQPPPVAIPLVELRAQADEGLAEISRLLARTAELGNLDDVNTSVGSAREEVKAREPELARTLTTASSLDALLNVQRVWQELDTRLAGSESVLQARAATLTTYLERVDRRIEIWKLTYESVRESDAPSALVQTARSTRRAFESARDQLRDTLDGVLKVQDQVAAARAKAAGAQERIDGAKQVLLANLWERDRSPAWEVVESFEVDRVGTALREEAASQLQSTLRLLREQREAGLLHILGTIGLALLLRAARQRTRVWSVENPRMNRIALVFERPHAIALLTGLALTRVIYDAPPIAVLAFAELIMLFPALVVIEPLVEKRLRPALFVLGGFYVFDQLRAVVAELPIVARGLFSLQMLLGIGVTAWLVLRERFRPAQAAETSVAAHPASIFLLRAALGAFAVAWVCAVLGYMRLGQLLGDGVLGSAYAAILFYAIFNAVHAIVAFTLRSRLMRPIHTLSQNAAVLDRGFGRLLAIAAFVVWGLVVLELFALRAPLGSVLGRVLEARLQVGSFGVSLGGILAFVFTIGISLLLARTLERLLEGDIYPRLGTPRGPAYAVSTVLRYTTVSGGFLIAVSAMGFDMDRLTVLVGAFGVGIGFGLQTIVNNFVSGLILLFERPIQLGDTIEASGVSGTVHSIGIRASIVRTSDGSDVSIPNGQLLSEHVVNWTRTDRHRRLDLTVSVERDAQPEKVIELLERTADSHPMLLSTPRPKALLTGFGANQLDFSLRAWVRDQDDWPDARSELLRAVLDKLAEQNIAPPPPAPTPGRGVPSGT
jgi:potassium-dependent mechanosensitive channel